MTGVDKLQAQGLTGKGIVVGIVDTGVDFTHPALGGCFGPGCKIAGGADLVGDAFNGLNTPVPGPIPFDCQGHGTHVSGILAADTRNSTSPIPFVGVAPGVTINMYRVFGCSGTTTSDLLIDGLSRAFVDGAQIISLSGGSSGGWSEDPLTVVANRLASKGIFLSIAVGNDGANGLFDASTPADAANVTAVTSVDSDAFFAYTALTEKNKTIVFSLWGISQVELLFRSSFPTGIASVIYYCKYE
jgi:subtilisin family serine protease